MYFLLVPKLMALLNGMGCKVFAFWSIDAKSNSDLFWS